MKHPNDDFSEPHIMDERRERLGIGVGSGEIEQTYTIFELLRGGKKEELFACLGCGQAYPISEFELKINQAEPSDYCNKCLYGWLPEEPEGLSR
jgi:hypothetical protein